MALWPCVVSGSIKFWYSAVMAALTAYLDANNDDVPNLSPSNELVGITGTVLADAVYTENADGTGYRRTIKELADTLRDYGAEEMFLRSRGSLRVRMDLADSDFQAFMSGDEDAICQFQGVFMQQYSWAEPMVCTLQEKKELMLARMGKHRM